MRGLVQPQSAPTKRKDKSVDTVELMLDEIDLPRVTSHCFVPAIIVWRHGGAGGG